MGWWKNGYPKYFGKSINAPSFIGIGININGEKLDLATSKIKDFSFSLDMHQGLLTRSFTYLGTTTTVRFEFQRFLHIKQKEAALINVVATVLTGKAQITFTATLDGTVTNEDSNYNEHFWQSCGEDGDQRTIQVKTIPNPYGCLLYTSDAADE